jgi:hypothetical protein
MISASGSLNPPVKRRKEEEMACLDKISGELDEVGERGT